VTSSAGTTYTAAQVLQLLEGPNLQMRWLFDLLSGQLGFKSDLSPLLDVNKPPVISHDSTRAVMREMTLRMRALNTVDPLQDLIRVRYELLAPDGGWLDWDIGRFMFTPPVKEIHEGVTWWSVTAPDLSQLLSDGAFTSAYSSRAGSSYTGEVAEIAANYGGQTPLQTSIPDNGARIPSDMVWPAGDSFLKAINGLLAAINYLPVWVDRTVLISQPIPDYTQVSPVLILDTIAGQAQIVGPLKDEPDYSNAYNQFIVTGQDPRRSPVSARYDNTRADSPVSLLNWHPRLLTVNDSTLADKAACMARARVEAQKAARVYSNLTVPTVPFPFFGNLDVVTLALQATDEGVIRQNFVITSGAHTCHASTPTIGVLQRVVAA
jgi:hypothetical protein